MVIRLELLSVHFALVDEVLESRVVDDRDEEEGRAVRGKADRWVKTEKEDGHVRILIAVDGDELEIVVVMTVEDGANNLANLV